MASSEFFVAGGTLRSDAPSYVQRPADDELFNLALASEFCYVLTPRQMGKSSLMIRTARRLGEQGVKTVIIDLTRIGVDVSVEQWYLSLLTQLQRRLRLKINPLDWWNEHADLGHIQRFTDFMEVVLAEIEEKIVVFVDEIDTTLRLDFRDDFFAAIRAMYNARAQDPQLDRLTFVLLGVASPPDLIKDRARTPFNIGHAIALQEFSQADAVVLRDGLESTHPGQGEAIFSRIYHWTNGHPYLTQKLCKAVAESKDGDWTDKRVDELVKKLFLSEEARKESNLKFVQDKILTHSQRSELLKLYKRVVRGKKINDDGQSLLQNQLKMSGLVKIENGNLQICNEIYRRAFDLKWIKTNTPVDQNRRIGAIVAIFALILAAALSIFAWRQSRQTGQVLAQDYEDRFRNTSNPTLRLDNLASLFNLQGYDDRGRFLFNSLTLDEKIALFTDATPDLRPQIKTVVKEIYTSLDNTKDNNRLLQAMQSALNQSADEDSETLAEEIIHWLKGRELFAEKAYQRAIISYSYAIGSNSENPATHFDRALALAANENYEDALEDLEIVLGLSEEWGAYTQLAVVEDAQFHAALWRERETHPTLIALIATPTPTSTFTPTPTPTPTTTPTPTPTTTPTPTPTTTPEGMIYVQAGEFEMGSDDNDIDYELELCNEYYGDCKREWFTHEQPAHSVMLNSFWIHRTEVTNAQYRECVEAGVCTLPTAISSYTHDFYYGNSDYDDYPIVNVTWEQTETYCRWIEARLPTEAEWEYTARGPEGWIFPWGNEWETEFAGTRINYCDVNCDYLWGNHIPWPDSTVNDGYAENAPVGSYPAGASWCGALDMAGNVWEWVADWHDSNYYSISSPFVENPTGPSSGEFHVIRGGSWNSPPHGGLTASRDWPRSGIVNDSIGFRCARAIRSP